MTTVAALAAVVPMSAADAAGQPSGSAQTDSAAKPTLVYSHLDLPDGTWARVYSDGLAEVIKPGTAGPASTAVMHVPGYNPEAAATPTGDGTSELPPKGQLIADLTKGPAQSYAAGQVVVIYNSGTGSAAVNKAQSGLGVDKSKAMFSGATRDRLASLRDKAQQQRGRSLLDFPDARVLHVTKATVADAVEKLRSNANVQFAGPNWTVAPTNTSPVALPPGVLRQARSSRLAAAAAQDQQSGADPSHAGVPDNYTLTSSAQSMLNKPADNVIPAYTALASKFGQLPGEGEIITNVSLGTLDDASDPNSACAPYVEAYGATTVVRNGQRYIDWPSMPLIPTYTASSAGVLDPTGETCGDDPTLAEVGLDFSMMSPLPHDRQRAGAVGSGLTDLLGIAPGAQYRLVLPATPGGLVTDVDAALVAAANQTPRPNVITMSLGFGLDAQGFPSRYLEDDALTESVIAAIVSSGIVVSVSAGDGIRTGVNTPVAPSGGSAATDLAAKPSDATDLNDVAYSSVASKVSDSGAMDVGGSTLNDITAAPPNNPANKDSGYWQAYPTTRYTGGRNYSSGFGSRVDISAPGDNVLSFSHPFGGGASDISVGLQGGTSASAPQAAAAAAIVQQVARLTGDNSLADSPLAIRSFLESTGTKLPDVPQSEIALNVGPQIDIGHAVEKLLAADGKGSTPGVARVAIAQRQQGSALAGSFRSTTDPTNISLAGRLSNAWITIAPDWTGLPDKGVTYKLSSATGTPAAIATTPWARLQPKTILGADGLPLISDTSRTVRLTYSASQHGKVIATTTFPLTFGPTNGQVPDVPAPVVPAVVTGPTIPVTYDLTGLSGATDPTLVVSTPGRIDPATGLFFRPAYQQPLTKASGTVNVPVSALDGGGIYGIGIQHGPGNVVSTNYSTFAFTRVSPTGGTAPVVPTLSMGSSPAGHYLEFPDNGSFQLHYDVRNVPGASGAIAEFSAPGPNTFGMYDTFNNPNGSERDANGIDTGSVAYVTLHGTSGSATLNGGELGLSPTMNHLVRVLATGRGGNVVGEASGFSSLSMDGIVPADGGSAAYGYGVNASGTDGLLTSNQVTESGEDLGSVDVFDQNTGKTTPVISSSDAFETLGGGCAGIYGNDTGVVDDWNGVTDTYPTLKPVSGGAITGAWEPPASLGTVFCAANTQSSSRTVVVSRTDAGHILLTPVNFGAGTMGTSVDLTAAFPNLEFSVEAVAYDSATNHGYLGVGMPGTIIDVDMSTGQASTFLPADGGVGGINGMAVDPTTNTAVIGSLGTGYSLMDLSTGTGTYVTPGGSFYAWPVWIPGTKHFMLTEFTSPDFHGDPSGVYPSNNDTMSSIVQVDESGGLVKRDEEFSYGSGFFFDDGAYDQPGSSQGFTVGLGGTQLRQFDMSTR